MGIKKSASDFLGGFSSWFGVALKQSMSAYCDLQTADSNTTLVTNDGSLVSIIKLDGIKQLVGAEEFERAQHQLQQSLQTTMRHAGHTIQVYFSYNKDDIKNEIHDALSPAIETAKRIGLKLEDVFEEQEHILADYCGSEQCYLVLWTRLQSLTKEQVKTARKTKMKAIKTQKIPAFLNTQNILAAIPDLRDAHESFVRLIVNDLAAMQFSLELLEVHDALRAVRHSIDPTFTDPEWSPALPGDKIMPKVYKRGGDDIADLMWPSLSSQLFPRDAENIDMRTCRIGDRIYGNVFISLFPKDIQTFTRLYNRLLSTHIPWRISFYVASGGMGAQRLRQALASILTVTSSQNRLISDSINLLNYIQLNTDDAVVSLKVCVSTWADEDDRPTLRTRVSLLAKAVEGWGSCDVTELSGDPFEGVASSMLAVSGASIAPMSLAPFSNVLYMLPLFRPASAWKYGALLLRSPDGKLWPYQPGSSLQTTWIDLFYARPGSGKSVLSNAINLAVCLSPGLHRLPRISIIDIGPSSSGLISLLKEALPPSKRHEVAYHRLRMDTSHAINPFDTQLGCRLPTPQERSFLVNFISLLVTPVGSERPYDGIADMSGMVVDELYKSLSDDASPRPYAAGLNDHIDGIMEEIGFVADAKTTWWEVTDALFIAGFAHEAISAQRFAMPVLPDITSICRLPAIEDLYGKIIAPTGETLIQAFSRMISASVREYPIISQVTRFDLGDAKVVALDLDEVARSGGDAAERQTAVMYMLARYVLARHYYLTDDNIADMPAAYRTYHAQRISEIREDPKRIVFDEFHRTSKAQAVRDQVILDMREGRKWKVQIALISQSIDDYDEVMIEFATSIFIMDAGPEQAVKKTAEIFGLSPTAQLALKTRVHGPREGGSTFLAQFATKFGMNTQLLTATLGSIELWALTTTASDVYLRNALYNRIGPRLARLLLAERFPSGSAVSYVEEQYAQHREAGGIIDDTYSASVLSTIIEDLLKQQKAKKK
jgi:intracellular multiplication protein IcmB